MELRASDLTLARRAFHLRVSLELGAETLALVGPSGAGKSTLLRVLAGLERPQTGRIARRDEVWLDRARGIDVAPERRRVGYLPQDYGLFPHLSVADNVRFAGRRPRRDLLERLRIGHLAAARPGELSGGERQRAALARALARDPVLLLLDEPFGALDAISRLAVRDELAATLPGLGLPTLLVTHAFGDALALADRVGVIVAGEIVQLDTPGAVQTRPATVAVAELIGANVLAGVATPAARGARIDLAGGGTLHTATRAKGPVQVAVAPWALRLLAPDGAPAVGRVIAAHRDGGTVVVRLDRLTVHVPITAADGPGAASGALVGVTADPSDVHIIGGRP